jgi:hypothetical protein
MGILLLNDTDEDGAHFGCQRVMRTIREELALRNAGAIQSLKVGTNWQKSTEALKLLDSTKTVVINGEGTLHHGKRKGKWLLDAGQRVKDNGGKVALVNALWQENPKDWAEIAKSFDVLWCRDKRSADALSLQTGRAVDQIGDLSMFHPFTDHTTTLRQGVSFSCSVYSEVAEVLAKLSDATGGEFVPVTKALKSVSPQWSGLRRVVRTHYAKRYETRFRAAHQNIRLVGSDTEYLNYLSQKELLVTGRFHGVCLAILSGTPFVAIGSNSWKISALLDDIGLSKERLQVPKALSPDMITGRDWRYSDVERKAISQAMQNWRQKGAALFDRIGALAQ